MNDDSIFIILRHLDEPKRLIGLTTDDCIIGASTIFFVMFASSIAFKAFIVFGGYGSRMVLKWLKKGNPPSYLLLLMYWYLPHVVTRLFIGSLPESHKRYWLS